MKQTVLLTTITTIVGLLSLGSASGPAFNRSGDNTGRISPALTCGAGGCHGATSSDIRLSASFIDKTSGQPVDGYIAGQDYEVRIDAINDLNANKRFGFQAVLVTGSNTQAGSIIASALPADYRLTNAVGVSIVEHRRTLTVPDNEYHVAFDWTAPQAGTGSVTLWAMFNAVNGNGSADAGDRCNTPFSTTIAENTGSSVAQRNYNDISIRIYPNPATDFVHIQRETAAPGNYTTTVFDLSGRRMYQTTWTAMAHAEPLQVSVQNWKAGTYFFHIRKDDGTAQQIMPFVRQ